MEDIREVKEKTLVVGAGGLAYHGLASMACESRMRGGMRGPVVFLDFDKIEGRNMERQAWPVKIETFGGIPMSVVGNESGIDGASEVRKAALAGELWGAYGGEWAWEEKRLVTMKEGLDALGDLGGVERVVVMALPDSNEARRVAARTALHVSLLVPEVWYVTAGNSLEAGQAWGYVAEKGKWKWDWTEAHPDLWDESKVMRVGEASCANEQDQSLAGNQLTANCLARVLRDLRLGCWASDWYWMEKEGASRVWRERLVEDEDWATEVALEEALTEA